MTHNNLTTEQSQPTSLSDSMLLGAGIGLILISFFLYGAGEPNPEWGRMWMIKHSKLRVVSPKCIHYTYSQKQDAEQPADQIQSSEFVIL